MTPLPEDSKVIAPGDEWETACGMLVGPIKHWWDENWGTPEHKLYVSWRQEVNDSLVAAGYLVYRPHEAFKGLWDERFQRINDLMLEMADVVVDLTPHWPDYKIVSEGTTSETHYARTSGTRIVEAPCPATEAEFEQAITQLLMILSGLRRQAVQQAPIVGSLAIHKSTRWAIEPFLREFSHYHLRVHVKGEIVEAEGAYCPKDSAVIYVDEGDDCVFPWPLDDVYKIEAVGQNVGIKC